MKNYTAIIITVVSILAFIIGCTVVKVSVNTDKDEKKTCIRLIAGKPVICRIVKD